MYEDGNDDDNEANVNATRGVAPMQAPKNGARAWNYFDPYDPPDKGPNVGNKRCQRCKFCKNYVTDHATRAKQHLHGNVIKGDAPACQKLYGYLDLNEINKI